MKTSDCCGAEPLWEDTDLCSACEEHADFTDDDCPVCGKEDSNGVPCSKDCLLADLM